jgi:hypothetical protein
MSTSHTVTCECGFSSYVNAGGTREKYLKECFFPHYCKQCGIVNVNTASKTIKCTSCNSTDIVAYGTNELSDYKNKEVIPAIQSFSYYAYRYRNFCPSCKKFTLEIEPPSILFD